MARIEFSLIRQSLTFLRFLVISESQATFVKGLSWKFPKFFSTRVVVFTAAATWFCSSSILLNLPWHFRYFIVSIRMCYIHDRPIFLGQKFHKNQFSRKMRRKIYTVMLIKAKKVKNLKHMKNLVKPSEQFKTETSLRKLLVRRKFQ